MLLGGKAANAVLGLAALGVAARGLGLGLFGVLILVHAFAEAVGEIAKFQSWQSVIHYGSKPWAEGRLPDFQRILRFTAVLDIASSIAGVVIGAAGAAVVGPWLKWPPGTAPAAMLYTTSVAFMVSATPLGVLRLFGRFDLIAGQATVASLVWLVGGVGAWALHAGLAAYLAIWWTGTFVAFVFLAVAAWRELRRRDALRDLDWRRGGLTQGFPGLWRFAFTTNANASLELAFTHVSTLIVGGLLNPSQAALWRVARLVGDAIAAPARMLVPALYPELARLRAAGDDRALAQLGLQVGAVVGVVATVMLALAIVAGGPLLSLAMGRAFAAAGPVMTWQVAAAVIGIWALPLEPILISTGRAGTALRTRVLVSAAYLIALQPLVSRLGVVGAGVASVGAAILMGGGMLLGVIRWRRDPLNGLRTSPTPPPPSSPEIT